MNTFQWKRERDGRFWSCTVLADGVEVYFAGNNDFGEKTPEEDAETRKAYEKEIIEEYTGEFVP
jgi:hypothetical protein